MSEHILISIASIIVLGIGAQWVAWRFRVPSILLLLLAGFLAGPITGFLPPSELQGSWVFAFVSLSIGIILFEGGLQLRIPDLGEVGRVVLNLITLGVLVTWVLAGLAAYYIAGFNLGMAAILGAILTVTGPTVVIPLLRHVRPTGRIGTIAKWEGITIDPVGAILAVLVLEAVLLLSSAQSEGLGGAVVHALQGLFQVFFVSVGVGITGAGVLVLLLRRRLVPDYLMNPVALMVVVATFALSEILQEESGLLTSTLMGIIMANQPYASMRRIGAFKEDLQVLLIGSLFVLLSARLDLDSLRTLDGRAFLFLGVLILLIRPVAVFISGLGTRLGWREKAFMAWLAPRGIVAAAVASLFAIRLEAVNLEQADRLVPIVFLVIVGTVAVYGLTISPLARYLGLAQPNQQGVLMLGAHTWGRRIALALHKLGIPVLLIDANAENIERAVEAALPARRDNALTEGIVDRLDLGGIGRFLALTPNDEVNALASLNFSEIFESTQVYQLPSQPESHLAEYEILPQHLRGHLLFSEPANFLALSERFRNGGEIQTVHLTEDLTYTALQERYDNDIIPLFMKRGAELFVFSREGGLTPQGGDVLIGFMPPIPDRLGPMDHAAFKKLIETAFVMDLESPTSFKEIIHQAAALFSQRLPITADRLALGFLEGSRFGATPVSHGAALPHFRLPSILHPELVLVRCRTGLSIDFNELHFEEEDIPHEPTEPVYAMVFLVSPEDHPSRHLRTLALIASRIEDPMFIETWRSADGRDMLKRTLLDRP